MSRPFTEIPEDAMTLCPSDTGHQAHLTHVKYKDGGKPCALTRKHGSIQTKLAEARAADEKERSP